VMGVCDRDRVGTTGHAVFRGWRRCGLTTEHYLS